MDNDMSAEEAHKGNMTNERHFYLREWRKHRGLTLEELGARIGTTKGRVSEIERGVRRYNEGLIEAFAKALDCEPWELLGKDPSADDAKAEDAPTKLVSIFEQIPEDNREQARRTLQSFIKPSNTKRA